MHAIGTYKIEFSYYYTIYPSMYIEQFSYWTKPTSVFFGSYIKFILACIGKFAYRYLLMYYSRFLAYEKTHATCSYSVRSFTNEKRLFSQHHNHRAAVRGHHQLFTRSFFIQFMHCATHVVLCCATGTSSYRSQWIAFYVESSHNICTFSTCL